MSNMMSDNLDLVIEYRDQVESFLLEKGFRFYPQSLEGSFMLKKSLYQCELPEVSPVCMENDRLSMNVDVTTMKINGMYHLCLESYVFGKMQDGEWQRITLYAGQTNTFIERFERIKAKLIAAWVASNSVEDTN